MMLMLWKVKCCQRACYLSIKICNPKKRAWKNDLPSLKISRQPAWIEFAVGLMNLCKAELSHSRFSFGSVNFKVNVNGGLQTFATSSTYFTVNRCRYCFIAQCLFTKGSVTWMCTIMKCLDKYLTFSIIIYYIFDFMLLEVNKRQVYDITQWKQPRVN